MKKKIWMVVLAFVAALFYTVVGPKIKTQNLNFDGSEIVPFILCFLICGVINILTVIAVQKLDFGVEESQTIYKGIAGVFTVDSSVWNYDSCTGGICPLCMATFPVASDWLNSCLVF